MNKNICIDIDGTITDPYHFMPYLNDIYKKELTPKDWNTYNWEKLYGASEKELIDLFHTTYIHSYSEADIVEGVKDIIFELNDIHNLTFVTARSEILKSVTRDWLDNNGLECIDVYLLGSDYKVDKAKELECNIFVEDNPNNAIQLADAGIKVFLIDTYYNKDVNHENVIRVSNWSEIKEQL